MLNKGRDGITALMAETDKYGLVLSKDQIDAVKKNKEAQRDLQAAMQGVEVQIGSRLIPVVADATALFAKLPGPIMDVALPLAGVGAGVAGLTKLLGQVRPAFDAIRGAGRSRADPAAQSTPPEVLENARSHSDSSVPRASRGTVVKFGKALSSSVRRMSRSQARF